MRGFEITAASLADAREVAAIYAYYVLHGTATWEIVPPSGEEMVSRMAAVLDSGWPWLVARAEGGGEVLGYAYAAQYSDRPGYRYACENSIYLHEAMRGHGLGTALLAALLDACEACGFRQMIAGIAGSEPASVALHAKAGFTEVARLKSVGRKHGQWLDLLYMQRSLGQGDSTAPAKEPA
jgi:phosphinothricin acetyltransferase